MRCDDVHQHAALAVGFANESNVAEPQVAQPAVDQLGGSTRGGTGEVAFVDERDLEPVRRRRLRDSGADDAAADHEQVELPRRESLECGYAVHGHPRNSRAARSGRSVKRPATPASASSRIRAASFTV